MLIRVLRNLGGDWPRWREGDTVEAADDTAAKLAAVGLAELIRAVPPEPEILGIPEPAPAVGKPDKRGKGTRPRPSKPEN